MKNDKSEPPETAVERDDSYALTIDHLREMAATWQLVHHLQDDAEPYRSPFE